MSEPYVKHIGKRRAYPAECPVCGEKSNTDYDLPFGPSQGWGELKAVYDYASHLFVREPVYGYKTWYYVCYHKKPAIWSSHDNPFLKMVSKDDFNGQFYPLPLVLSEP